MAIGDFDFKGRRAPAGLRIWLATAVLLLFTANALGQSGGASCSLPGSVGSSPPNGTLICGADGNWHEVIRAQPASDFGDHAAIVQTVGNRFAGAMNAIIKGVQSLVRDLLSPTV